MRKAQQIQFYYLSLTNLSLRFLNWSCVWITNNAHVIMSTHRKYKEVIKLVTSEKKKILRTRSPVSWRKRHKPVRFFIWLALQQDLVLCWCQSSEEMQRSVVLKAFITPPHHQNNQVLPFPVKLWQPVLYVRETWNCHKSFDNLMAVVQNLLSSRFGCDFVHCLSESGCTYFDDETSFTPFHCSVHDLEGYSLFGTVIAFSIENGGD